MDQADKGQGSRRSNTSPQSMSYEIRVQGQLDPTWSDWFNGLKVIPQENGETVITGPILDQTALQGILTKIFNMRLPLLLVRRIPPES